MLIFSLIHVREYETSAKVYKLLRNGKCMYDEFISEIEKDKNLSPELDDLEATIEDAANNLLLPQTRYRKLHISGNIKIHAYEAKSKHLRIYLVHEPNTGKILILGGKKKSQTKDIKNLTALLKQYQQFKDITKTGKHGK